jgi:hypothetical protein
MWYMWRRSARRLVFIELTYYPTHTDRERAIERAIGSEQGFTSKSEREGRREGGREREIHTPIQHTHTHTPIQHFRVSSVTVLDVAHSDAAVGVLEPREHF